MDFQFQNLNCVKISNMHTNLQGLRNGGYSGTIYRSASQNQLTSAAADLALQPPALNPWLQPSLEQSLDQIGRLVRIVILDHFEERSSRLDRMRVQLKGAVEAYNGSRAGRHQAPPIDEQLSMQLLKTSVDKRDYVEKTIREAQERMGRTLEYDKEEIVDQMVTLAKIDVQKENQNKKQQNTSVTSLKSTQQINPLRLKRPNLTDHKRSAVQAGINRTVLHMKNPLSTITPDKHLNQTLNQAKKTARNNSSFIADRQNELKLGKKKSSAAASRAARDEQVDDEMDENMQFLINLGRRDPKMCTLPAVRQTSEQKYRAKVEREHESKFKLLLKYLAIWKKYVKLCKLKRKQAKKLTDLMMKAIQYRDSRIMRLILFSLKKHSAKQQTLRHCEKIVRWNQDRALKAFFFKTMRQKFVRARRRLYLDKVAGSYYQDQRKFKVLKFWHRVVKNDLNLIEQQWAKMKQFPFAAELLLEKVAHDFYLSRLEGSSISDIVRFHYYALKNFTVNAACRDNQKVLSSIRIRPQLMRRFSAAVELILRAKQARIFKHLVRTAKAQRSFREGRQLRMKQNVWHVFALRLQHSQKTVFLAYRRKRRLIALVFREMTGWLRSRIIAKQKQQFLAMRKRRNLLSTYLTEWHSLWAYYSRFTSSTYNYTSAKLSQQKFLLKYFEKLKEYTASRQRHNFNKQKADQKFYDKYARICLHNWMFFAYQQKKLVYCRAVLTKKTNLRVKADFLSRWIAAKREAGRAVAFDRRRLLSRAFRSFQARINYLKLKDIIAVIAVDKSKTSLQLRAFIALARYSKKKRQLRSMSKVLVLKHQRKLAIRSILALQKNVESSLKKKQKEQFFVDYARTNLIRIAFNGLVTFMRHRRELNLKRKAVEDQVMNRRMRSCFSQMYLRYLKRQSDRLIGERLSKAIEASTLSRHFSAWLNKYRRLAKSHELVKARHDAITLKDAFKLWRSSFSLSRRSRFDLKRFDEKRRMRYLSLFFSSFVEIVFEEKSKRENNLAADWLNSKNLAAKSIKCLYEYARRRQLKRTVQVDYDRRVLLKCFSVLCRRYVVRKNQRLFLQDRLANKVVAVFAHLASYARHNAEMRQKEIFIRQNSDKALMLRVLRVLSCPSVYTEQQFEVHEIAKMRNVLASLKMYAEFNRSLKERHDTVQAKAHKRIAIEMFIDWLHQARYERALRTVALPFFLQRQQFKLHAVFTAIKENVQEVKNEKAQELAGVQFHEESLKTRSIEALRWYANEKIHARNQIEFMKLTHAGNLKKTAFIVLQNWTQIQQDLKVKRQVIEISLQEKVRHRVFKVWMKATMAKQVLDEDAEQIDKVYQLGLKRSVFKAWYDYRTERILKKHMTAQATLKWQLSAIRRSFSALAWYSLAHRRVKAERAELATHWQRRKYLRLWYGALIKAHVHGQQICEVPMTRGSTGPVELNSIEIAEGYMPNRNDDAHRSVVVTMSTGNDAFQPVFGSGAIASPSDSAVKVAKSQTQLSFGQMNRSDIKPQHVPRISILSETLRPIESVDLMPADNSTTAHHDLPLQMSDKQSSRKSQQDPYDDQSAFLESLSRLQTSDELRQAHDEMTLRLQSLLKEQQRDQPEEDVARASQEYTQLKDIIQLIRSKYEESLAAGGIPANRPSVIEEENSSQQETSEEGDMSLWLLKLRQKVFAGLRWRVQITRERRETQSQMACKARCLLGLKLIAQQAKAAKNLAVEHYETRQKRIGIFSLKKNQLIRMMQRTIQSTREDRMVERYFAMWRFAYQVKLQTCINDQQRDTEVAMHKHLSMGNETDEVPQEMLGFNVDPAPFDGFNEDTDEEERKQAADFPEDDYEAPQPKDESIDSVDAREDRIMEFPLQRSDMSLDKNEEKRLGRRNSDDEYMVASSSKSHDSLDMLAQFVTSAENTTGSGGINKTDTLEAYVMERFNQDKSSFELGHGALHDSDHNRKQTFGGECAQGEPAND